MTTSIHIHSTLFPRMPILAGAREGRTLAVYDGGNVPDVLAGQYARLAYMTLGAFPAMLLHFDFDRILTRQNLLVFVQEGEELLSGAYAVRELRGDKSVLMHKGYASTGKGLAKVMIAALHLAEEREAGSSTDGEAVARVMPSGDINQASSTAFADLGFHGVRNFPSQVGNGDIHLAPTAERQGDGLWVGAHLMAGRGEKITVRAREALAGWTLT